MKQMHNFNAGPCVLPREAVNAAIEALKDFKGTGVPSVEPLDAECKFTKEVSDYQGRFVKDCDKDIMDRLKKEGKLPKKIELIEKLSTKFVDTVESKLKDGTYSPRIENDKEELTRICWETAHKLYGEELPEIVKASSTLPKTVWCGIRL
mgnify:CR=1 FL=1